jgi:hypothetical protein
MRGPCYPSPMIRVSLVPRPLRHRRARGIDVDLLGTRRQLVRLAGPASCGLHSAGASLGTRIRPPRRHYLISPWSNPSLDTAESSAGGAYSAWTCFVDSESRRTPRQGLRVRDHSESGTKAGPKARGSHPLRNRIQHCWCIPALLRYEGQDMMDIGNLFNGRDSSREFASSNRMFANRREMFYFG